ncbi:hypothetical protein CXG81DRAFT_20125 [Caulochytrium protostelioides]|uniref:Cellulase n=1 Tax=Caulochytrium protostelioides TaxID=1555241 RepID=A0A4P9X466_9FUNG|nr:hypothetical protein CXG81DRAFT_20125 [Caulochytrium protostelioides]|eukprot:RKO99856.1 hypothetical protein CXG81DRAFT_20125 [Caulochytrium protostelioides]
MRWVILLGSLAGMLASAAPTVVQDKVYDWRFDLNYEPHRYLPVDVHYVGKQAAPPHQIPVSFSTFNKIGLAYRKGGQLPTASSKPSADGATFCGTLKKSDKAAECKSVQPYQVVVTDADNSQTRHMICVCDGGQNPYRAATMLPLLPKTLRTELKQIVLTPKADKMVPYYDAGDHVAYLPREASSFGYAWAMLAAEATLTQAEKDAVKTALDSAEHVFARRHLAPYEGHEVAHMTAVYLSYVPSARTADQFKGAAIPPDIVNNNDVPWADAAFLYLHPAIVALRKAKALMAVTRDAPPALDLFVPTEYTSLLGPMFKPDVGNMPKLYVKVPRAACEGHNLVLEMRDNACYYGNLLPKKVQVQMGTKRLEVLDEMVRSDACGVQSFVIRNLQPGKARVMFDVAENSLLKLVPSTFDLYVFPKEKCPAWFAQSGSMRATSKAIAATPGGK